MYNGFDFDMLRSLFWGVRHFSKQAEIVVKKNRFPVQSTNPAYAVGISRILIHETQRGFRILKRLLEQKFAVLIYDSSCMLYDASINDEIFRIVRS